MGVATATITSNGTTMDPGYRLMSLAVTKEVNRIPSAEIRLLDGNAATQQFPISDTAFFEPGSEVEIKLRYEGDDDHTVFKGLVVRHGVEAGPRESYLTVHLKDAAVKLTQARRSVVYADKSDSDVIGAIVAEAGLSKGDIPATKPKHEEIVQYHSTDWDFLVSRADVNGLLVIANDGEISLAPIEVAGSANHKFEFGLSVMYDFEMEIDGGEQPERVESVSWDLAAQELTEATEAAAFTSSQGDLKGEDVARKVGFGTYTLSHPVPVDPAELQAWADSKLARARMAMIQGRVGLPGLGDIALLDVIEIGGVGKRFNGTTMVTGLVHRLSAEGWLTDVQFGLAPDWFSSRRGIQEAPAAGLLPAVGGLQIGVVADSAEDPAGEFRVRVAVPGIDAAEGLLWARLAAPDAGVERGWFFRPEVGDEVVLGFFNDDPRRPVVLGSLYSSANTPPPDLPVDEDNYQKGIVTRSGMKLILDDEKPSITVETPGANSIVLDDDEGKIIVTDQHGNTVTLSEAGMDLSSAADMTIAVAGDLAIRSEGVVEITAGGDLKAEASGNVEIKGSKVDVK